MSRTHVSDDCNEAGAAAGEEGWPVAAGGQEPPHFSPFSRDTGDAREATAHPRGRGKPARSRNGTDAFFSTGESQNCHKSIPLDHLQLSKYV